MYTLGCLASGGGSVLKQYSGSIVILNPSEYFHAAVSGAVTSLKVNVSEHAQSYIVHLLSHFISIDNFYPTDSEGNPAETLTQQLANALEEESTEARALRLRQMGDFSLYVAGFFTDSLNRKLVDVDYYIGMGEAAYGNVALLQEKKSRSQLFQELSYKFSKFVDILAQISEETGFHDSNPQDLLRIYDLWLKTGSERLAKQLARAGIAPVNGKGPKDGEDA